MAAFLEFIFLNDMLMSKIIEVEDICELEQVVFSFPGNGS